MIMTFVIFYIWCEAIDFALSIVYPVETNWENDDDHSE